MKYGVTGKIAACFETDIYVWGYRYAQDFNPDIMIIAASGVRARTLLLAATATDGL